MKGKYLFFDVDGTLAGSSRSITEKTKWAVQRAREMGHKVFMCTGRSPASIVGDVTEMEFDGTISGAGSFVEIGGTYIFEHYIEPQLLRQVMDLFNRHHLMYTLETKEVIYQTPGAREFFEKRTEEKIAMNPELARFNGLIRMGEKRGKITEFDITKTGVAKMCFISMDRKEFDQCRPFLEENFNIVVFSKETEPWINGEIILKDCTKGDGIRRIMNYFHGDMEDTVGFGDSMNDYQMLEVVHVGVAFEAAPEKLKKLAKYYFKEPDNDGIYDVMIQMGLIDDGQK